MGVSSKTANPKSAGYPCTLAMAPSATPVLNNVNNPNIAPIMGTNINRHISKLFKKIYCGKVPFALLSFSV
jgi:hypothetical protein